MLALGHALEPALERQMNTNKFGGLHIFAWILSEHSI